MAQTPTRDLGVTQPPKLAQKRGRSDTRHTENIYAKFYKGKLNVNNMLQQPCSQKTSRKLAVRKTFKCGVCHVTFSSMRIASRHVEYYRQPKYPCEECGTKFADTRQLEFHVAYTHGEVKNLAMYKLQCPVCKQMAGTKTFLQSHLYHYHNEWAVKNQMNQNTFASKSMSDGAKTSADIEAHGNDRANVEAKIMKSPRMISMLKHPEDTSRSSMNVRRFGGANSQQARGTSTSSSYSKQDIGVPFAKTHRSPIVFETVLNGIKVEGCDDELEGSGRFSIPNRPSENDCDEMLRVLHSCKECYVPLSRIRVSRTATENEKPLEKIEEEKRPEELEEEKRPEELEEEKRPEEIEEEKQPEEIEEEKQPEEIEAEKRPEELEKENRLEQVEEGKRTKGIDEEALPKKLEKEKRPEENDEEALPKKIKKAKLPEEINEVARTIDYFNDFDTTSLDELSLDECPIKSEPEEFSESTAESSQPQNTTSSPPRAKTAAYKSRKNHPVVRIASKICDKYFPSKRAMQRHFRQRHMIVAEDVVYCVCGKTLPGRREKEKHFYEHCGELVTASAADTFQSAFASCRLLEKRHECPKCGEKFWLDTCLQDHQDRCRSVRTGASVRLALTMELHCRYDQMSRSSAHHVCTQCNTGFNSSSTLWQHKQKYAGCESHQCPICKTLFSGRRLLKGHIQSAHESSRKKLYTIFCEICNQGFTKNLYKRIHIMHCHSIEVEKSIKGTELIVVRSPLPEPPKIETFETARASEVEETPAHPSPPTPPKSSGGHNKCTVCNIEFVSRKRFIDHMIYYRKKEIVYCGMCGKDFRGQYVAHHHNKKFHYSRDMQNSYTHRCTICQDGFMYRTHLQAHVSHVHGNALRDPSLLSGEDRSGAMESWKPEAVRSTARHSCPVCEILFPTAAALMNHQTQYSNDGDFACNQCPRKCLSAAMLLDHIALNHSDGVIVDGGMKCSRCNEYFLTRAGWVSHVKHFHNSEGDEPSEFCFESNLTSSREFGYVEIELIPMNDSISSGMAYINYGSLIDLTGRDGAKAACTISTRVEELGQPTTSGTTNEGKVVEKIRTNCATCGFACAGTAELADHMGLYSNTGRYNCIICDRRFLWRRFFEDHKKKHFRHSPEDMNFCPTCGEGFEKIADMRMHEAHLHRACSDIGETNGLPPVNCMENSDAELKRETEQDKVPFAYECPISKKKFPTEVALDAHLTSVDKHVGEGDASNSGEGPSICVICDMVFVSKKLLKVHESNYHSSVAAKPPTPKQCPEAGDRFYVLAGVEILPESVEVLQKNFDRCNKRLGLTNSIYRYGPSYKCDICNVVVTSKDSLNDHQTKIHTVSSNHRIDSENAEEPSSKEIIVVEKTQASRSGFCGDDASTTQAGTKDPPKKTVLPTFTKSILKSVSAISETRVMHYRCKICDLIFVNKNLLRVHKVNGNCVKGSIERADGDRPDKEKTPVTKELRTLTNGPPVGSEKTPVRPAVAPNASTLSPNRMRFISLPPGNYRVGKLNVRPFGKIVQNLIKHTGHKRKNEMAKNPPPVAAKRVKKVFDPVAYRELCRQHNLIPATVSPELTTPKNLCEKLNCTDCCAINQLVKEKKYTI